MDNAYYEKIKKITEELQILEKKIRENYSNGLMSDEMIAAIKKRHELRDELFDEVINGLDYHIKYGAKADKKEAKKLKKRLREMRLLEVKNAKTEKPC